MKQAFEERLLFLEESKLSHFNISEEILNQITPLSIYALMVLKRSLSLVFGFTSMMRQKNFLCAAPIIRLQIDNLLRFRAAFLVDNQSGFVVDVLEGKEVRNLKDRSDKRMTDAYLQDKLSNDYPWIKSTYKKTSGYIHLSEEHFHNTVRRKDGGEVREIELYIGADDQMVSPDKVYEDALENMILVTHSMLTFIGNWASQKKSH